MSISLILIGVISAIVIGGTGYLTTSKSEQVPEEKRSKILLIVGIVIFASLLASTFKHPGKSSNSYSTLPSTLTPIFFPSDCSIRSSSPKYNGHPLPDTVLTQLYSRNFRQIDERDNRMKSQTSSQHILYLSKKDQGATYFLSSLANKDCISGKPSLYVKLTHSFEDEEAFARIFGFTSYSQMRNSLCGLAGIQVRQGSWGLEYISRKQTQRLPTLYIDNFNYLLNTLTNSVPVQINPQGVQKRGKTKVWVRQRLLGTIIEQLAGKCKTNIFLNTQQPQAISFLYKIWDQSNHNNQEEFPFEFHEWEGLKHYDIYRIISKILPQADGTLSKNLETSKKDRHTFKDLYELMRQLQEGGQKQRPEDKILKDLSTKQSVARFFGLEDVYRSARSTEGRGVSIGKMKHKLKELRRLQDMNLIQLKNGEVIIE